MNKKQVIVLVIGLLATVICVLWLPFKNPFVVQKGPFDLDPIQFNWIWNWPIYDQGTHAYIGPINHAWGWGGEISTKTFFTEIGIIISATLASMFFLQAKRPRFKFQNVVLNGKQIVCLSMGMLAALACALYPPWSGHQDSVLRGWYCDPPRYIPYGPPLQIEWQTLTLEIGCLIGITLAVAFMLRSPKKHELESTTHNRATNE